MAEITCATCGKVFTKANVGRNPIYCSTDCRAKFYRSQRSAQQAPKLAPCAYCGQTFSRTGAHRYCSTDCATKAPAERRAERLSLVVIQCGHCGDGFSPRKNSGGQRYCSPTCRNRATNDARRSQDWTERPCPVCGTTFKPKYPKQQTCSRACMGVLKSADSESRRTKACGHCGGTFVAPTHVQQFCSKACGYAGTKLPVGTRRPIGEGYWIVRVPADTPGARPDRDWMPEHRYQMQCKLGRPLLEDEEAHHLNGDRSDNSWGNLELWSTSQPKGQRVEDKVAFGLEMLCRYAPHLLAEQ